MSLAWMPPAWQVLAAVTGFEHVLCEFSLFKKNWLRFRDGYLCYSGEAVERGLVYTLATASLCHGNTSHMVNNVVMLAAVGPPLEARWGSARFTLAFFGCGAVGWLTSYSLTRARTDADTWRDAARYQEGYGSSPATYALAVVAAWVLPRDTPLGPWPSAGWSWASTIAAVCLLPHALSPTKRAETWRADVHQLMLVSALWSTTAGYSSITPCFAGPTDWLVCYHLNTFVTLVRRFITSTLARMPLTDHPSHLGGAIGGAALGAVISTECHSPRAIAVTIGYLGTRVLLSV